MRNLTHNTTRSHIAGCLFSLLTVLVTTGCEDPEGGGTAFTLNLPTDTLLNLHCPDAGITGETCVLDDPENPFVNAVISEFSVEAEMAGEDQPASNKFNYNDATTPGAAGAKARFYLWATALARFPSGENQYYTALALHELFDDNADPVIQAQALRAYRSVLDNHFGTVTFFGPFTIPGDTTELFTPQQLNLIVADILRNPATNSSPAGGFAPLFDDDPTFGTAAHALLGSWGYTYIECTLTCPTDGVLYTSAVP
jgi:hypothetical protein